MNYYRIFSSYRWAIVVLLIGFLGLFLTRIANADINEGTGDIPWGGSVTALSIDPYEPSTIYAGTEGGGVFKSTDGGNSWASTDEVYDPAIDPYDPSIIYNRQLLLLKSSK